MEGIRKAALSDAAALKDIYNYYIENTTVTYEYEPLTEGQFAGRIQQITQTYPYLVYEKDGKILGYAYAARFRERAAFSWDAETTVYLAHTCTGRGIGSALYGELLSELSKLGIYTVYSLIDFPNEASERLHEKFGFQRVAVYEKTAYKAGRWCDLLVLQKVLRKRQGVPQPLGTAL